MGIATDMPHFTIPGRRFSPKEAILARFIGLRRDADMRAPRAQTYFISGRVAQVTSSPAAITPPPCCRRRSTTRMPLEAPYDAGGGGGDFR